MVTPGANTWVSSASSRKLDCRAIAEPLIAAMKWPSKVVATRGGDALGFKNPDGSVVAVVRNAGAARTATVAIAGKKLQFGIPADGWATIVAH